MTVEYDGQAFTLAELADHYGLSRATVKQRHKNGWSVEDIVRTPHKARKKWSERQAG